MVCPVCGKKSQYVVCPDCGFDSSRDYERYPTLGPVQKALAVSAQRKAWQARQRPEEKPQKKRPWLPLIACIATLILGIGIGAGLGGGKPTPTEPEESLQMQVPMETKVQTVPIETTEPTVQPTTEMEKEPWTENALLRDNKLPTNEHGGYLMAGAVMSSAFGSEYRREQIKSITFLDTLADAPENSWDASEAGDGRVLAWVIPNGELYDLYIGAEGGVSAGTSCEALFAGYTNLQQIHGIEFFHTENVQDMSYMFAWCSSLSSLDWGKLDTQNVLNMSNLFYGADFSSLDLSDLDTSNVQNMEGMFYWCDSLTNLDLSGLDTGEVENMNDMFAYCESLTSLNLSNFDTSNVMGMNSMFSDCKSLTSLDLSSFRTISAHDMGYMFENCASLTSLDLSGFNTFRVISMMYMFAGCDSLTSLDLSNFDTSWVSTMESMFEDCYSLTSLDLSGFDTSNVVDTSGMFDNCPAGSAWQHLLK